MIKKYIFVVIYYKILIKINNKYFKIEFILKII
jgi:hypothetical protein